MKQNFSFLRGAKESLVRHAQRTSLSNICLQPPQTGTTVIYITIVSVMGIMALAHKL